MNEGGVGFWRGSPARLSNYPAVTALHHPLTERRKGQELTDKKC